MKSLPFRGSNQKIGARNVFFVLGGVLVIGLLSVLLYEVSSHNNSSAIPPNSIAESSLPVESTETAPSISATSPIQEILTLGTDGPARIKQATQAAKPSSTSLPTIATSTQVAQPTDTSTFIPPTATQAAPCYQIGNLKDMTIPSGTEILAGQTFTKIWTFQNTGSCSWGPDTRLMLTSGALIYPSDHLALGESITSGASGHLSIDVTAPSTPGTYLDTWMLYTSAGESLTNEYGEDQEFTILITVLPSVAQINGRIVKDGIAVGSGVTLSLEDPINQTIATASTLDDGTFTWTNVSPSEQGYNVVFSQAANNQFGIDQALSWVWVGPIPVHQGEVIQLDDIDISSLGFGQSNPEPETVFSGATITPNSPVVFQWSAYPGGADYWVDLVDNDEVNVWQSRLVSTQATSFEGTLRNNTHIQPGEYWWAVGARRWLGEYQQIVYTYLMNISVGD